MTAALAEIDTANGRDPNQESEPGGEPVAKELLYARRMTAWLERLAPDASEAIRLAARAQHIERWTSARADFAEGREGYNRWRRELAQFHARRAGEIMEAAGYDGPMRERVAALILKKGLKTDPETQLLEDVICLVFLENYFADFSEKHDPDKIVDILRKTWRKMSPRGHDAALALDLPAPARALVERALAD